MKILHNVTLCFAVTLATCYAASDSPEREKKEDPSEGLLDPLGRDKSGGAKMRKIAVPETMVDKLHSMSDSDRRDAEEEHLRREIIPIILPDDLREDLANAGKKRYNDANNPDNKVVYWKQIEMDEKKSNLHSLEEACALCEGAGKYYGVTCRRCRGDGEYQYRYYNDEPILMKRILEHVRGMGIEIGNKNTCNFGARKWTGWEPDTQHPVGSKNPTSVKRDTAVSNRSAGYWHSDDSLSTKPGENEEVIKQIILIPVLSSNSDEILDGTRFCAGGEVSVRPYDNRPGSGCMFYNTKVAHKRPLMHPHSEVSEENPVVRIWFRILIYYDVPEFDEKYKAWKAQEKIVKKRRYSGKKGRKAFLQWKRKAPIHPCLCNEDFELFRRGSDLNLEDWTQDEGSDERRLPPPEEHLKWLEQQGLVK